MESKAWDAITDFFDGVSGLDLLIWLVIGVIVLGGIVKGINLIRKSLPAIKRWIEHFEALAVLPEMKETLDRVHHEVFPNHGGSMRDAIDRGNAVQAQHDTIIKNIDLRLTGLTERVDPITAEIPVIQRQVTEVQEQVAEVKEIAQETQLKVSESEARLDTHLEETAPILQKWSDDNKE